MYSEPLNHQKYEEARNDSPLPASPVMSERRSTGELVRHRPPGAQRVVEDRNFGSEHASRPMVVQQPKGRIMELLEWIQSYATAGISNCTSCTPNNPPQHTDFCWNKNSFKKMQRTLLV